jgi:hypothetical protein
VHREQQPFRVVRLAADEEQALLLGLLPEEVTPALLLELARLRGELEALRGPLLHRAVGERGLLLERLEQPQTLLLSVGHPAVGVEERAHELRGIGRLRRGLLRRGRERDGEREDEERDEVHSLPTRDANPHARPGVRHRSARRTEARCPGRDQR